MSFCIFILRLWWRRFTTFIIIVFCWLIFFHKCTLPWTHPEDRFRCYLLGCWCWWGVFRWWNETWFTLSSSFFVDWIATFSFDAKSWDILSPFAGVIQFTLLISGVLYKAKFIIFVVKAAFTNLVLVKLHSCMYNLYCFQYLHI